MAKREKSAETPETTTTLAEPHAADFTRNLEPAGADMATEGQAGANGAGRHGFRSWVTDAQHGYHRLTDDERRRIVLMFDEKPGGDVLQAMKNAGFRYQADYHGHKHAWVRRNDFEGRFQLEAIEKLIRGPAQELESAAVTF